jgi:uncharacterized protein with PIN domain
MLTGIFCFHDELNDILPSQKRGSEITLRFNSDQSVKHLIESLGVPHTEIGRVLVNGQSADLSMLLRNGDRIDVYPPARINLSGPNHADAYFVADNHLGQLAVYLRMLGFDTLYRNDYQDDELAQISSLENRILLTRDRRLLMRNLVQHGYWVRSKVPRQQLVEVLRRFGLCEQIVPFKRCMRCNGLLQHVNKEQVLNRLKPLTKKYYEQFRLCPDCQGIYWQGSHYTRMMDFIAQVELECENS